MTVIILHENTASAQEYPFIQYTPKDGLLSGRLRNVYQDDKGRMFFMTANGLSIYDGSRFTNYTVDAGLANPIVNDMLELGEDSFLVATNVSKLNSLVKGRIKEVAINGFVPVINKFYKTKSKEIYVATDYGLFELRDNRFVKIVLAGGPKDDATLYDDVQEAGDYLLLKQYDAHNMVQDVFLVHRSTKKVSRITTGEHVYTMTQVSAHNVLLLTTSKGMKTYDLQAAYAGLAKECPLPELYKPLSTLPFSSIAFDPQGNLWAYSATTVYKLDAAGRLQVFDGANGLHVTSITKVHVDRENVLWILTDGSGIVKLANRNVEIVTGLFSKLPTDISAVYNDLEAGSTWVFNYREQDLYCLAGSVLKKWKLDKNIFVSNILRFGDAIYLFEQNSIHKVVPDEREHTLHLQLVYNIVDTKINFARAITDGEMNLYMPGSTLTVIKRDGRVLSHPLPEFSDQIAIDSDRHIWAATRSGDLIRFSHQEKDGKELLQADFNYKSVIPFIAPRSVVVDNSGKVWVGTRFDGLYCFEFSGNKLVSQHHFTTKDGLTENFVYYLACDSEGVIWAGTQGGLDKISLQNGKYLVEGVTRRNNIFQIIQFVSIGKDNQVWAVGNGSLIRVNSESSNPVKFTPQLHLVRIRSADTVFNFPPDGLRLSHRFNQLVFDVAAPSFIDERQVRFSYLLEGTENTAWSNPSTQATFNFINLPQGEYTLRVRAFFPLGDYSTPELAYHFRIMPPWWNTWWFRSIVLLAGIAFIVFIIRSYYQRKLEKQKILIEKQRAVENERSRIAMEMHDDLGSGLTTIRYLASGLMAAPPDVKEKAAKIAGSAKELVDIMNDIIWTMKSDNNSLEEVLAYIRKQTAEQVESASLECSFEFPKTVPNLILTNEQKRNLLLISKEAVHNAVKHANATSVQLKTNITDHTLELCFSDNGRGIDVYHVEGFGNGLKNMRRRAEELGGTLEIQNEKGTVVILKTKIDSGFNGVV